jgi:alpha-glucosidase
MNEPTSFDRPFTEGIGVVGTLPLDAVQGQADERTTHAETHNCYGQGMARATYEGLRKQRPDERPFVLTRSGFAGIQCWSACWMGDNSSMWEHLEMSMPQMMNMGLSGVPFVGTDIGGFFGHCSAELLARWIQFGIFSPFCRGHSCTGTAPQEPWVFGPQVETIYREYVQLRYRLLPYLYSLFWEATQQGTPVLRPLFYHFPDDPATYQLHDQVLFGPAFMAAPVYQPGRTHRAVYLPQGQWFDWWTDERISGPAHILADAPLERMPLYVRAGAIIPGGPAMAYTDEKPLEPLTLDLFPGSGAFTMYEDDGRTLAYQQGAFCTMHITMHLEESVTNNQVLTLTIGARTGAYRPPQRRLVLRLHDIDERTSMRYPEAAYDSERRLLIFQFDDDGTERVMHFHRD